MGFTQFSSTLASEYQSLWALIFVASCKKMLMNNKQTNDLCVFAQLQNLPYTEHMPNNITIYILELFIF